MIARENPFAAWRVECMQMRLPGVTTEQLLARFEVFGRRAAIVGPKGHGKTTLLDALEPRLRERGFIITRIQLTEELPRLTRNQLETLRSFSTMPCVVLLDGAEQLNWWRWRELLRVLDARTGLLITTHRAGRLPTLIECETSPGLLEELIEELLPQPIAGLPHSGELFHRHRGNLRDALRELYDRCARAGA